MSNNRQYRKKLNLNQLFNLVARTFTNRILLSIKMLTLNKEIHLENSAITNSIFVFDRLYTWQYCIEMI